MRSLLLGSISTRILFSAVAALLIHAALVGFKYYGEQDAWARRVANYQKWEASDRRTCEDIWNRLNSSVDPGNCASTQDTLRTGEYIKCLDSRRNARPSALRELDASGCPTEYSSFLSRIDKFPKLRPPEDPGSWDQTLEGLHSVFVYMATASIITTVLIYLMTQVLRDAVLIPHVGWRRLTSVVSFAGVVAGVPIGFKIFDHGGFSVVVIALASGLGVAALMTYGRKVSLWVWEGFGSHERSKQRIPSGSQDKNDDPSPLAVAELTVREIVTSSPDAAINTAPREDAPSASTATSLIDLPRAKFWARLWARCIDISIAWSIALVINLFVPTVGSLIPGVAGIVGDAIVSLIVACSVLILYDTWFLSAFGATPGKAIFGIRVISLRSRLLTWSESNGRAFDHLNSGLYFMLFFPTLQLFGAIAAWRRHDDQQPWDRQVGSLVVQKPINYVRYNATAMVAFVLIVSVVVIENAAKSMVKQQMRSQFSQSLQK